MSGDDGFGWRVRQARERIALSQEVLARRAALGARWLGQIEAGKADPKLATVLALYRVLVREVPGLSLTWLVNGTHTEGAPGSLEDAVKRSTLRRLAAATLPTTLPLPMLDVDTERLERVTSLDDAQLEVLESLSAYFARLRPMLPPRELRPLVDAHLAVLRARFDARGPVALRRRLWACSADAAILAAWASLTLEWRTDARAYLRWAEEVARGSGDTAALALTLHLHSDLHSPIPSGGLAGNGPAARRYLDEALAVSGPNLAASLRASLLLHSAEEHAFGGSEREALYDLQAAEAAFAQIDPAYDRPHASLDAASLAGYRGSVLQMLGRPREAIEAMTPAVAPERLPRARSVALVEGAGAYGQLGELERACELLGEAVDIAEEFGLVERARRVATERRRHLGPWDREPVVRRLDERLTSIL